MIHLLLIPVGAYIIYKGVTMSRKNRIAKAKEINTENTFLFDKCEYFRADEERGLTFCLHPEAGEDNEDNCREDVCPLIKDNNVQMYDDATNERGTDGEEADRALGARADSDAAELDNVDSENTESAVNRTDENDADT